MARQARRCCRGLRGREEVSHTVNVPVLQEGGDPEYGECPTLTAAIGWRTQRKHVRLCHYCHYDNDYYESPCFWCAQAQGSGQCDIVLMGLMRT